MTKTPARQWTEDEIWLLELMSQRFPIDDIAKRLNRTHDSVRGKMWTQGISPYLTVDQFSPNRLAGMLGISHPTIVNWIKTGDLPAIKREKNKRLLYRIKRKDFAKFYRQNINNTKMWALKRISPDIIEWLEEGAIY